MSVVVVMNGGCIVNTNNLIDNLLFVLSIDNNCPLDCTYCCMEFADADRQSAPKPVKRLVVTKLAGLFDFLSQNNNQRIGLALCNGEPLLQLNIIDDILCNINNCNHIDFELLSSFRFDAQRKFAKVFNLIDKWIDFLTNKSVNFYFKWSIHMEYYSNVREILLHYKKLKSYNIKLIPIVMINNREDIKSFQLIKHVIPEMEYQLTLNDREENVLLKTLNCEEIQILKSINYSVRDKHIVDRVLQNDWSFTGLGCGYPGAEINSPHRIISVSSNGELARCSKNYMYPGEKKHYTGNILSMSNEQLLQYIKTDVVCPYSNCNLCASNCVGVENV